jgi:hypothetical protein
MNKTILTFGFLSAAVAIVAMATTIPFMSAHSFELADILGYTTIVLAALLTFFGIRSYREHTPDRTLTFGRGFLVGLAITLISCVSYAAAFEIVYFKLVPDFGDTMTACMVERVRAKGGSAQEVEETAKQMATFKRLFDNPLLNPLMTFAESFPIGLIATTISAALLRKR